MSGQTLPEIDVHELARKLASGENFLLLDVREAWEVDQAAIAESRLEVVAMSRLAQEGIAALPAAGRDPQTAIYVLCHHGVRSAAVTTWLISQGWQHVFSVRGGIDEYARSIDPTVGKY
ncbi:MAG: rhodanese-like domain-containing protein [Anaerolineae bacterium]